MWRYVCVIGIAAFVLSAPINVDADNGDDQTTQPLVLAHYMPWYAAPPTDERWGWHWTMNRFNPNDTDANGRRQVASHQYPLIEPYATNDPDLLENHVLLMKLAGIDGIIIDWYGFEDVYDYRWLNETTHRVIEVARRAGLGYAVCYEDRTVRAMVNMGRLSADDAVAHGNAVMEYLRAEWFGDPLYLKWDGRPLFLIFGPEYYSEAQWEEILSANDERPMVATLHERKAFADGAFAWLPMWAARDGTLTTQRLQEYVETFTRWSKDWTFSVAAAFPGFHDIYQEAGVMESHGYLDDRRGETFRETLDLALNSAAAFVQLATWNDYGEGTVIEPTADQGFRELETLQTARRQRQTAFPYEPDDLRLPVTLYRLRKQFAQNPDAASRLDAISQALFDGDATLARERLDRFLAAFPTPEVR
ncbi:MAG: glycoside hydrolase family 71/99-like protein [Candidatus Poribacteria bacterium]|nr:glycoside hydrolase family 71/99-like protein [Candidatus Poribacteria bacterium]